MASKGINIQDKAELVISRPCFCSINHYNISTRNKYFAESYIRFAILQKGNFMTEFRWHMHSEKQKRCFISY